MPLGCIGWLWPFLGWGPCGCSCPTEWEGQNHCESDGQELTDAEKWEQPRTWKVLRALQDSAGFLCWKQTLLGRRSSPELASVCGSSRAGCLWERTGVLSLEG